MLKISKPLAVAATVLSLSVVLSACHFSDGEYGPASGGAGLPPASTVNTNGPVGANTTAPTTKLLGAMTEILWRQAEYLTEVHHKRFPVIFRLFG